MTHGLLEPIRRGYCRGMLWRGCSDVEEGDRAGGLSYGYRLTGKGSGEIADP